MFRGWVALFRVLPGWAAYGFADLMVPFVVSSAALRRARSTRMRRGFHHNAAIVFRGTLSSGAQRKLLWRWARHMTHLGIDLCKMPQITAENMRQYCDLSEMRGLRECYDRGAGMIAASGHGGVYEYSPHLMTLSGVPVVTIFRASPIPIITDIINEIRTAGGQRMVEREGAVRELMRARRNGEVLGVISDVSSKDSAVFAPFLGTDAATNTTAGILHLKTDAPILVMTTQRIGRQRYKFHVWDKIERIRTGDRAADLRTVARRISAALTKALTVYPEQWFWDSRRFRTRPVSEPAVPGTLPPQVDPEPAAAILKTLGIVASPKA